MKIGRVTDGVRVKMSYDEARRLAIAFDYIPRSLIPGPYELNDAAQKRLFPAAYVDDAESEAAFRDLTESALRDERIARARQSRAEMGGNGLDARAFDVVLDPDAAERWIRVINDVRLIAGTYLNITSDDDYRLDRKLANYPERLNYVWLTGLQDLMVQAMMR